ncbi:MAG: hypothetical protein AABZ64_12740, partial [Nitrospinota bacterium]
ALLIGQGLEPVLEAAFYGGRLGYPVDGERWTVFWECVAGGLPALAVVTWRVNSRGALSGTSAA